MTDASHCLAHLKSVQLGGQSNDTAPGLSPLVIMLKIANGEVSNILLVFDEFTIKLL